MVICLILNLITCDLGSGLIRLCPQLLHLLEILTRKRVLWGIKELSNPII